MSQPCHMVLVDYFTIVKTLNSNVKEMGPVKTEFVSDKGEHHEKTSVFYFAGCANWTACT